ncbi:ABC transporter substrate-binding protein [Mycetocola zhadangensis]|nr:ABC transporter substrate-binding protein [Mycetocola zhadangensis]GGE99959.1 hypothetical protein GCM10011313_23630 [Mycetocola zhadangensis]
MTRSNLLRSPLSPRSVRRRFALVPAVAAFALLASGCASSAPASTEASGDGAEEITVLYAAIAYEPLLIAEQQGYFADAGLNVEIKRGGPPQDNLAQAVGGSADIITAAWDTMVASTAEGMAVRVVAGNSIVSDEIDTSGVVVRDDSGLKDLSDLKGATVAFDSLGAGGSSEFYAALDAAGVRADEVNTVAVPYAGMAASLENGQVDAVIPTEPFYSQLIGDDANEVIANPVRETRAGAPITLWAATDAWLEENADAAEAFVEALQKGIDFYDDPANLEEVAKIRAEVTQVPVDEVSRSLPPMRLAVDTDAAVKATDQLAKFGTVSEPLPVDEILWSAAPVL